MPVDRLESRRLSQGYRLVHAGAPGRTSARLADVLREHAVPLAAHGVTVAATGAGSVRSALAEPDGTAARLLASSLQTAGPAGLVVLSDESLSPDEADALRAVLGEHLHVVLQVDEPRASGPSPQVERWVERLGRDAVSVVADSPTSPDLVGVVGGLLGLPDGTLGESVAPVGPEHAAVRGVWRRRADETDPAPEALTSALLDAAGRAMPEQRDASTAERADLPLEDAADALYAAFCEARDAVAASALPAVVTLDELRPLPLGTRILHVGLPAAGSDVVQGAWRAWSSSDAVEARSGAVVYPGERDSHDVIASAVLNAAGPGDDAARADLARAVARLQPTGRATTVLSAERLALADAPRARAVVAALRRASDEPLHVVLALRSVPELLVAAWQQHVVSGSAQTLDDWLRGALQDDGTVRMGGLDALREDDGTSLVARWVDALGAANVTVVVERRGGRDTLEALAVLAGLAREAVPAPAPVRPLTAPETELVRLFNATLPYRTTVTAADRRRFVRRGAVAGLTAGERPVDDAPVTLPPWALDPARAAGRRLEAQLLGHPVVVVGDPAALSSAQRDPQAGSGTELHRSSVEAALLGMFDSAVRRPAPAAPAPPAVPSPPPTARPARPLAALPLRELLRELVGRAGGARTGSGEVS